MHKLVKIFRAMRDKGEIVPHPKSAWGFDYNRNDIGYRTVEQEFTRVYGENIYKLVTWDQFCKIGKDFSAGKFDNKLYKVLE